MAVVDLSPSTRQRGIMRCMGPRTASWDDLHCYMGPRWDLPVQGCGRNEAVLGAHSDLISRRDSVVSLCSSSFDAVPTRAALMAAKPTIEWLQAPKKLETQKFQLYTLLDPSDKNKEVLYGTTAYLSHFVIYFLCHFSAKDV